MKKLFLLSTVIMLSLPASSSFAEGTVNGYQYLLEAVTACKSPNNPLNDVLKPLGGNLLEVGSATQSQNGDITLEAAAIKRGYGPIRLLGKFILKMSYVGGPNHINVECSVQPE